MENTNVKSTPKDFFLHLLSNLALYYSGVWLIALLWQYVNYVYPPFTDYYGGTEWIPSAMRWAIASLVIMFPVYIGVTKHLNTDMTAHPEKKDLRVRKWFMYFTLFAAALTIIIDLIALIFNLLEGDFATAFVLKVLSVLLVAGLIFGYYFAEIRRDAGKPVPRRELFRYGSIVLVALAVIGAFFVVGSPATARMRGYDMRRVSDLQTMQWQMVNYWQQKQRLPATLADLVDPISGFTLPVDPETGMAYGYKMMGAMSFQLCADFGTESMMSGSSGMMGGYATDGPYGGGIKGDGNWQHGMGNQCFTREIDPDRYPPVKR